MSYEIEVRYDIYDDDAKKNLTVMPCPDIPGLVCFCAFGSENESYYGDLRVSVAPEQARLIVNALIKCAGDLEQMK